MYITHTYKWTHKYDMYLHITRTCIHVNRHVRTILHMHIPKCTHAQNINVQIHTQTHINTLVDMTYKQIYICTHKLIFLHKHKKCTCTDTNMNAHMYKHKQIEMYTLNIHMYICKHKCTDIYT